MRRSQRKEGTKRVGRGDTVKDGMGWDRVQESVVVCTRCFAMPTEQHVCKVY